MGDENIMDKISIIVPVYNAQKYLKKCIDSIINQTYKNIEILLINDGSKDKSLKICKEYEKKDSRIIVIDKQNKGVSNTRNVGIKKSTGDYIVFIDSDDCFELDAIETMYKKYFIQRRYFHDGRYYFYCRIIRKETKITFI